jgi:protoporphyrin/coproporphyrin ferrochelatase
MHYLAPSAFAHGTPPRCAVLLVNLGTPSAPTAAAVRTYLQEFLLDPRVVELPRLPWWLLLHGVVLPLRARASAQRYASVWTPEGSPLMAHSERQQRALMAELRGRGLDVDVVLAMRYGQPSLAAALETLRRNGTTRLLVVPMYPQYAGATAGSVFDGLARELQRTRNLPELRWLRGFADDAGYIDALQRSVREHWRVNGRGGRLVMSFHGLPRHSLDRGDPYHCECHKTARLLAEALELREEEFVVTFQSRFGRARWLQPYTADTLRELARAGVGRVDLVCPGFVADCLETLEELDQEARRDFLTAGGREFHRIACLNDAPRFVAALADLVERNLHGWPVRAEDAPARREEARRSLERARSLGAPR